MSDHIPFEIQTEILKKLPIKSLLQFRSVSKQWKSLIDSSKFINNHHTHQTHSQHHLLVRYKLDTVRTYTSIIDNDTFPQHKFPLTAPESLSLLRHALVLGSSHGLLCFYGFYRDVGLEIEMVVLWNPTVRKSVGIVVPNALYVPVGLTMIGFGICSDTNDPMLVRIDTINDPSVHWEVEVFLLSTRVWRSVSNCPPFRSCDLTWGQVFLKGFIYWHAFDDIYLDDGIRCNYIVSFDLKIEKFGEVCVPERLVHSNVTVSKVNESLSLLEYYNDGELPVCGVWVKKDGVEKPFTKMFTVKVPGKSVRRCVLGFRMNSEVILNLDDYDDELASVLEVYEPSSGRVNGIGINGKINTFSMRSYMETLLLLDQSHSIIQ